MVWVPIVGTLTAVAVPLTRFAEKRRQEHASVAFTQSVRAAQEAYKATRGRYASDLASLRLTCARLMTCDLAVLERDYYFALSPASSTAPSQHAYAMQSDGRIYLFFDGVAPKPADMESGGLATPLEDLEGFTIP